MAKNKDLTQCPYCFAEIDAQARKCCYCGEWVEEKGGRADSSRGSQQAKPAHEVITEHFDEAVRTQSVVFAVVALVLFFIWPPAGFILSIIGLFTGPRKGCFGAMLVLFVLLPLFLTLMGIAVGSLLTGGALFAPHIFH